jgi:polyribonucleotide nucleotidyltransferase
MINMIKALTASPEVGKIYDGVVKGIKEFGAFVEIMPGKEGLLHISEIDVKRVENVADVLKMGDKIQVKLLGVDDKGKLKLSRRALLRKEGDEDVKEERPKRREGGHSRPPNRKPRDN